MMKLDRYGVLSIVVRNSVQYFKKAKLWGAAEQCVAVLRALALTAGIIATQRFFDAITEIGSKNNYSYLVRCLFTLAFIITAQHILSGLGQYLLSKISYSNMGKFMTDFQRKLGRLPAETFEDTTFLDKAERAKECLEYESLGHFASVCLQLLTYYIVLFVSLGHYLFQLSPILPFVLIVSFIPAILGQLMQMRIFVKLENENLPLRRQSEYYKKTIVDRKFYKETRMLGGFQFFHKLFIEGLQTLTQNTWKTERKAAILKFLLGIITFLGLGVSILILFQLTISNDISVGAFASVFTALSQIFSIMDEIVSTCLSQGSETIAQVVNFYRLMDMEEVSGARGDSDFTKGIVAENVSFTYPGSSKAALHNVSLTINKGETIAIVGENGSGKSTLVRILTGLYSTYDGKVIIAGQDSKMTHPDALYTGISGVFQNYQRYKMTLEENVSISDTKQAVDYSKIKKVLQKAEFNEKKVNLQSMLSPEYNGVDLSGGQWQRLAIARGLYRNHSFIILDEPTAAIDPIEEARLYNHFKQIVKNKSSIIVTHRLGSVRLADRIVVMDQGKLAEIGTHEELLAKKGKYAAMWQAQIKWYEKSDVI